MPDDAFSQLVDQFYPALYRFALSMARSEADACDLTQQTFYIWAQKGHALREAAKAKAWLFTTLYREFLRGRRRGERLTALDSVPESQLGDPQLDAQAIASLDAGVVLDALQRVDEVFRAPLTLFYLESLSYQEIAETLDVPVGTVMSRLSRGKAQLRAQLSSRVGNRSGSIVPIQLPNTKASHG